MAKRKGKRNNRRAGRASSGKAEPEVPRAAPLAQTSTTRGWRRSWWLAIAALVGVVAIAAACLLSSEATKSDDGPAGEAAKGDRASINKKVDGPVERLRARVIRRYPHQRDAFTQGLVWHDGVIYESSGGQGNSSLRMVELETGEVLREHETDPSLFAEGLAVVGDLLVQITWKKGRALVFRRADFAPVRQHSYKGEGWGLCYDGANLVMSDGSDRLIFRDPATFARRRVVHVTFMGKPLIRINELECVEGVVWANVWKEEAIVRIDPRDGRVTAMVDASGLLTAAERRGTEVLNGIAWMPESGRFLLTGKNWPWLFEVEFERRSSSPTR